MGLLGPLLLAAVSIIWAQEDYFPVQLNNTWDNARNYCQICYKDLTTMTPGNAYIIIQKVIAMNLTSGYWIGLRENFSGPIAFSQWSNGAPVIYQNWYPGRPILKKPDVIVPTSPPTTTSTNGTTSAAGTTTHSTTAGTTSTSGTTPIDEQLRCPTLAKLITCLNGSDYLVTPITDDFTTSKSSTIIITSSPTVSSTFPSTSTTYTTTALITSPSTSLMTSTSYSTPIPETDYDYIKDSCVALLSFGMWREKHCYESLPFICYDEQFTGIVNISSVTHDRCVVTWEKAPGDNVDHYSVSLSGSSINSTVNTTDLTTEFQDLEAGNRYTVYVTPVKCARDLNSLNTMFYTLPMTISNLTTVEQTTNSIALNWSKPEGGCENYYIKYVINGTVCENISTDVTYNITGLLPGQLYNFTARCVVNNSIFGNPSQYKLVYTKPSRVQNLTSLNNESSKIYATWGSSDSNSPSYHYHVILGNGEAIINDTIYTANTYINLENLTPGTEYTLNVSAMAGDPSVEGEAVNISAFTMPMAVNNLNLASTANSITATWELQDGNFSYFSVQLKPNVTANVTKQNYIFSNLRSTTQYTISVSTVIGILSSLPVNQTIFTLPKPPTNFTISVLDGTRVRLNWSPPADSDFSQSRMYNVMYMAPFWSNFCTTFNTTENTTVIANLTSGTKYFFNVSVYAGNLLSNPVSSNASTVTNFRNLTLTMLCSSNTALYCKNTGTKKMLKDKLKNKIEEKFQDIISWALFWKDGKF